MRNILVFVTQEHIENSSIFKPNSCMVANALKDAGFKQVRVAGPWFEATSESCQRFPLSYKVSYNIAEFDTGGEVKPFSFIVENVDEKYLVKK